VLARQRNSRSFFVEHLAARRGEAVGIRSLADRLSPRARGARPARVCVACSVTSPFTLGRPRSYPSSCSTRIGDRPTVRAPPAGPRVVERPTRLSHVARPRGASRRRAGAGTPPTRAFTAARRAPRGSREPRCPRRRGAGSRRASTPKLRAVARRVLRDSTDDCQDEGERGRLLLKRLSNPCACRPAPSCFPSYFLRCQEALAIINQGKP